MKMSTRVKKQTLSKDMTKLMREMRSLRSFFISMVGEDPEGTYKPGFVKRMREALDDKPIYSYTGRGSLLKQLKKL